MTAGWRIRAGRMLGFILRWASIIFQRNRKPSIEIQMTDIVINVASRGRFPVILARRSLHECRADLRVCLNCQTTTARGAAVRERARNRCWKGGRNFCEYFEFAAGNGIEDVKNAREDAARERMKKLFGD